MELLLNMKQKIEECFLDWSGDFVVDVVFSEVDGEYHYYDVAITHKYLGDAYCFASRIMDGSCSTEFEFAYCEDHFEEVSKENLFSWMWFESVPYNDG
jgi:hypothetical protein